MLPGTDPGVAGEYVLLMAHLDHLGIREPRPGDAANADRINNGAMDNATGIATLIEVARADEPARQPAAPADPDRRGDRRGDAACSAPNISPAIRSSATAG